MKRTTLNTGLILAALALPTMAGLPTGASLPAMFTGRAARVSGLVTDSVSAYQTAHFMIVYSLRGPNAMASVDKNQDGVNDYLVSLGSFAERAWSLAIDSMGFKAPPLGAESTWYYKVSIPAGKLPIEVGDMGTMSVGFKGKPVLGYSIAPSKTPSKVAEILIENDFKYDSAGTPVPVRIFSPRKNVNGDSVLYNFGTPESIEKGWATAIAHEFFHCVEMSYENTYIFAFHEMSAAWFAMRAQPTVTYHWGTNQEFLTLLNGGVFQGNGQGLFVRALAKYVGDGFIRKLWELRARNLTQSFLYPEEQWFRKSVDSLKLDIGGFFKYYASEVGCIVANSVCDLNDNGAYFSGNQTYRMLTLSAKDTTDPLIVLSVNQWAGDVKAYSGNAIHGQFHNFRMEKAEPSIASGYILHFPSRDGAAFTLENGPVVINANPEDETIVVFGFSVGGLITGTPTNAPANVGVLWRPDARPVGVLGRFDLSGQPVVGESRGVYFERANDGSVRRLVGWGK